MATREERFWAKVDKSGGPDACWLWIGNRNPQGYGMVRDGAEVRGAHRVAWELHTGVALPRNGHGTCVCHRCDVRACVNPSHLFLGTVSDNMRDMVAKGRQVKHNLSKTHCPAGHAYSPDNVRIKVNGSGRHRECMACDRARALRRYRRVAAVLTQRAA